MTKVVIQNTQLHACPFIDPVTQCTIIMVLLLVDLVKQIRLRNRIGSYYVIVTHAMQSPRDFLNLCNTTSTHHKIIIMELN
jgi:hypothetical protein